MEFEVAFIAATTRLHRIYATSEPPILCQERRLVNVNGFDAVHGNREAKTPCRGISDVGRIHDESTPVLSLSFDFDLAVGSSDDSRYEGKCIGGSGGPGGNAV